MPVFAKKAKGNEVEHGTHRLLDDLPPLPEKIKALGRLEAENEKIIAAYRRVDFLIHEPTPQESRIKKLTSGLLEKVGARTAPLAQASEAEGADLAERRAACESAIAGLQREIRTLRAELSAKLYSAEWKDEHFSARQRIARAIIEAAEAIQAEQKLANRMAAAGAISGPHFGSRLWLNVSSCPLIPSVFRQLSIDEFKRNNSNLV
jgi:hypothetical protein